MEKIKQEQQRRKAAAMSRLTVEGLSAEREAEATGSEITTALLEAVNAFSDAKQRSTRSKGTRAKKAVKVARKPAKSGASSSLSSAVSRTGSFKESSPMVENKTKAETPAEIESISPSAEQVAKSRKQEGSRETRPLAAKGKKDYLALQTTAPEAPGPQPTPQQKQPALAAKTAATTEDEESAPHDMPETNQVKPPEAAQPTSDALAATALEPKLAQEEEAEPAVVAAAENWMAEKEVELSAAAEESPAGTGASAAEDLINQSIVSQLPPATQHTAEIPEQAHVELVTALEPPQPSKPAFDRAARQPREASATQPSRPQRRPQRSVVPPASGDEGIGGDEEDARDIDDDVGER